MKINYLTTNNLKFEIAKRFFNAIREYELVQLTHHIPEIQDTSCEEIARQSAIHAAQQIGEPCIVMDAGFFIPALNGFPGPFVKYVNEWISEERLLRMLDTNDNRAAYFTDALAVGFPDGTAEVFSHRTMGRLANKSEYRPSKWPANSLFIPDGHTIPLGSLSNEAQTDFWASQNENWPKLIAYLKEKA